MRIVVKLAGVVAALVALLLLAGAMLPRDHVARVERVVPAPRSQVARLVRDVAAYPTWRTGVTAVDATPADSVTTSYVEHSGDEMVTYRHVVVSPDRQYQSEITDATLPYGGLWTITLTDEGLSTKVEIEERGFVTNLIFRVFSRFVFGHTSTMLTYLDDLTRATSGRGPS